MSALLHVVFKVADSEYILAAEDVLQMESYSGTTHVPGALPYVAGVIQVRGRVVPVVDVRARFGLTPAEATLDTRVVVVEFRDRTVGLLVDRAREVIKLLPEQLRPPPQIVGESGVGFVKAVAHIGSRLLMLVDFAKIIGEETVHGS